MPKPSSNGRLIVILLLTVAFAGAWFVVRHQDLLLWTRPVGPTMHTSDDASWW